MDTRVWTGQKECSSLNYYVGQEYINHGRLRGTYKNITGNFKTYDLAAIAVSELRIAHRFWSEKIPIFYVSELKTKNSDWGYSTKIRDAILLTKYQQMLFAAYCRDCKVIAVFLKKT